MYQLLIDPHFINENNSNINNPLGLIIEKKNRPIKSAILIDKKLFLYQPFIQEMLLL